MRYPLFYRIRDRTFSNGQAAANVRETYFSGDAVGKLKESGKELVSQTTDMVKAAASGDPRAIGQVAGVVVGAKAASELQVKIKGAENVDVVHYTNEAGAQAIQDAGQLRAGTYVTTPDQIPAGATAGQVEAALEIAPGKGTNSLTVQTPRSNLTTPPNGTTTSGGAAQYQLKEAVKVSTSKKT